MSLVGFLFNSAKHQLPGASGPSGVLLALGAIYGHANLYAAEDQELQLQALTSHHR